MLGLALAAACIGPRPAAAGFRENFESPETSWSFAAADAAYRVQQHRRLQTQAHWGHGCEQLRIACGLGTHVYFGHEIGRARVIDELEASVWVKADRPGIQLLARVVFPRAVDPATGEPVTALLQGTKYTSPGGWQRLTLDDAPQRCAEQARVLRLQLQQDVDVREAYLDLLVLNTYSSAGVTNILIDDLEIDGYLPVPQHAAQQQTVQQAAWQTASDATSAPHRPAAQEAAGAQRTDVPAGPGDDRFFGTTSSGGDDRGRHRIELRGAVMLIDGQPFFPRIIEHRGESFEFLRQLGFNAVRLASPPTPWQVAEARRNDLWIVAPPPDVRAGRSIGPAHNRVLAWDLGGDLHAQQIAAVRDLAFAVRRADEQSGRPLLAEAAEQLRSYSRIANVMLLRRAPLGGSFELAHYRDWFQARGQLLRPGTPAWATIQTEPPAARQRQSAAAGRKLPENVEPQQLRLLALSAIAGGARGLSFASRSRLDGEDAPSLQRAQALEMLNRQLELIEPWLAVAGHAAPLRVEEPNVQAALFDTQRSQLILLTQIGPGSQHVAAPPQVRQLSLVVPGVPESSDAYLLTPTGLRPLPHRRVTGGIGVAVEDVGWASAVVFTSDPLAYARLAQTAARNRHRVAQLQLATTSRLLQRTQPTLAALAESRRLRSDATRSLALIQANLKQGQRMLAGGDAHAASAYASRAAVSLAQLRRESWAQLAAGDPILTSPLEKAFALPLSSTAPSAERASLRGEQSAGADIGGNMEDLQRLVRAGWRHFRRDQHGIQTHVELSSDGSNTGQFALRLEATRDGQQSAAHVESPPVWIRSPNVPIQAGTRYTIHGWVRVDAPLSGTFDGLLIHDSVLGRPLAIRVQQTRGWRPFTLRGIALRDQPLTVNFELTGLGEAFIDDVEIIVHEDGPSPAEHKSPSTASRLRDLIRLPR